MSCLPRLSRYTCIIIHINQNNNKLYCIVATYMLGAIKEMAEARPEEQLEHAEVLDYLTACSLLFEKGTLSHE